MKKVLFLVFGCIAMIACSQSGKVDVVPNNDSISVDSVDSISTDSSVTTVSLEKMIYEG